MINFLMINFRLTPLFLYTAQLIRDLTITCNLSDWPETRFSIPFLSFWVFDFRTWLLECYFWNYPPSLRIKIIDFLRNRSKSISLLLKILALQAKSCIPNQSKTYSDFYNINNIPSIIYVFKIRIPGCSAISNAMQ